MKAITAEFTAQVVWERRGAVFVDQRYSRGHRWCFDEGIEVPASASPHVVPPPLSVAAAVDPEEAFVASLASCHMLWFLSIAAQRGFVVDSYHDRASGVMLEDSDGKLAIGRVALRPIATFAGKNQPARHEIQAMHESAHESCFIARSVKTIVSCQPG